VIIPSGPILGAPVETLVDADGRLLAERFSTSYAPSATVHAWLKHSRSRKARPNNSALLVGDPAMATAATNSTPFPSVADIPPLTFRSAIEGDPEALATLPRLAGSRKEVEAIARVVGKATILLGTDASEQAIRTLAVKGGMREFRIIHLATHALIDDGRPERSALVLSQVGNPDPLEAALARRPIYDGLLTAREVVAEWDLDAELVVLSACATGTGRKIAGEGYLGLSSAFLEAGARSLVVSLWPVDDTATTLLMRRLYENLGAGASKATALQEARGWLRTFEDGAGSRPFEHPAHWAAFVLIGSPD
jgi:CHAT domain-containing protein